MYKIKSLDKKEGSVVEIFVEFPVEDVEAKWQKAIKSVGENAKIDGFRPGHIPEKVLVEKAGEMTILEEASRFAIDEAFTKIVIENKLKIIGHPNIVITKIGRGVPLEATMRVTVVPEIKLPDYAKIASKIMKKEGDVSVTDADVEKVMDELRAHKFHEEHGANHDDHDHGEVIIDDEFVKKLGDFKDVEDFKTKIKGNIAHEKEYKARETKRIETLEEIRKDSKIDVPEMLVENELDRMMSEFSHRLSQMGRTLEEYKKDVSKTEEQMREEWKEKAKGRTENELILLEIARIEKLSPKKEDVEHEVSQMEKQYPGTPKERIEGFVEEILTKEEVFKFLEEKGK